MSEIILFFKRVTRKKRKKPTNIWWNFFDTIIIVYYLLFWKASTNKTKAYEWIFLEFNSAVQKIQEFHIVLQEYHPYSRKRTCKKKTNNINEGVSQRFSKMSKRRILGKKREYYFKWDIFFLEISWVFLPVSCKEDDLQKKRRYN